MHCLLVPRADWHWRREAVALAAARAKQLAEASRRLEDAGGQAAELAGGRESSTIGPAGVSSCGATASRLLVCTGVP